MPDTAVMASKKRSDDPSTGRHKPRRMAAIKIGLAQALEPIIDRNFTDFTTEVNRAVKELCEREGTLHSRTD